MTETGTKQVHLDDVDVNAFAIVVKALYADDWPRDYMKLLPLATPKPNELAVLINCYVALDRVVVDEDFKDAVLTRVCHYIHEQHRDDLSSLEYKKKYGTTFGTLKIDSETIILGLNALPDPDPIRLLLVDLISFYYLFCDECKEDWLTDIRQNVPDEVTMQMMKNLKEAVTEGPVPKFLRDFRYAVTYSRCKGGPRYSIGYNTPKAAATES